MSDNEINLNTYRAVRSLAETTDEERAMQVLSGMTYMIIGQIGLMDTTVCITRLLSSCIAQAKLDGELLLSIEETVDTFAEALKSDANTLLREGEKIMDILNNSGKGKK